MAKIKDLVHKHNRKPLSEDFSWTDEDDSVTSPREKPHPVMKVPGCRNPQWDKRIGRWVIYRGGKRAT
jgi:hypothetical protein